MEYKVYTVRVCATSEEEAMELIGDHKFLSIQETPVGGLRK